MIIQERQKAATTILVAAANTLGALRNTAQHLCDGLDDEVQINAAINSLYTDVASESVTLGTFLLVDDMNDPIVGGWTAANGDETLTKEDVEVRRGSSLKVVPGTADLPGATLGSLTVNASTYTHVDFYCKCPRNAKLKVTLDDGTDTTLLWWIQDFSNEWQRVRIPLAYAYKSDANLAAITDITIQAVVDAPDSDHIFYLDEIGFSNATPLANRLIEYKTVAISGATEGTDFDVDHDTGTLLPNLVGTLTSGGSVNVAYTYGGGEVQLLPGKYGLGTTTRGPVVPRSNLCLKCEQGTVLSAEGGANYVYQDAVIKTSGPSKGVRIQGSFTLQGYRDSWPPGRLVQGMLFPDAEDLSITGTIRVVDFNGPGLSVYRSNVANAKPKNFYLGGDITILRCSPFWIDEPGVLYNQQAGNIAHKAALYIEGQRHFFVQAKVLNARADAKYVYRCEDGELHVTIRRPAMGGFFCHQSQRLYAHDLVVDGAGSRGVSIETGCEDVILVSPVVRNSGREAAWLNGCSRSGIIGGMLDKAGLRGSYGGTTGDGPTGDDVALIRFSGTGSNNFVNAAILDASTNEVCYRINTGQTLAKLVGNHVVGVADTLIAASSAVTYTHIPGFAGVTDYEPADATMPISGVALYADGPTLRMKRKSGDSFATSILYDDNTTAIVVRDNFNRANATRLNFASGGFDWLDIREASGNFGIASNAAIPNSGTPIARAEANLRTTNHYAQAVISSAGVAGVGVGFGGASPADGYIFMVNNATSATYRIFKFVGGTLTQLATTDTTAPGASFTARLEIDADGNMDAKIGGVSVLTHTDTSVALGKKAAIYGSGSASLDDFEAGDL